MKALIVLAAVLGLAACGSTQFVLLHGECEYACTDGVRTIVLGAKVAASENNDLKIVLADHELGHIILGHNKGKRTEAEELAADQFALSRALATDVDMCPAANLLRETGQTERASIIAVAVGGCRRYSVIDQLRDVSGGPDSSGSITR